MCIQTIKQRADEHLEYDESFSDLLFNVSQNAPLKSNPSFEQTKETEEKLPAGNVSLSFVEKRLDFPFQDFYSYEVAN